jgi:hypothetical protein
MASKKKNPGKVAGGIWDRGRNGEQDGEILQAMSGG